jgi:hypothetical protein
MHIMSVFGPFASKALVLMSVEEAMKLVPDADLGAARPSRVVDAAEHEIERIRERDPDLADSAVAASAIAMAYEIEHPFNSATSKSMCQARLVEAMKTLRELAPPEERPKDGIDQLRERRAKRRARSAAS